MAIIVLMAFTPLGYLIIGPALTITFIMIPVVIGAITLGPAAGALLGAVFGLTSFARCFGAEPFGMVLLGISPVSTFITCMVPRVLMGWLSGLIFKALYKIDKTRLASYAVSCLSGAVLNTVLFMSSLMLLFGNSDYIMEMRGGVGVLAFVVMMVGINGVVEALVCLVAGAAISKALDQFLPAKAETKSVKR